MPNRPRRNRNRVTRLSLGAGRLVLRPTRAVAGDMLEPVAEAAVDHALAGPLPEAIAHSLVEHRVIERIVREMLATGDISRLEQALDDEALERTVERVLASPRTERLIGDAIERALASDAIHRVLTSPEFEHLLTDTMSSPAVRNAIADQTVTLGDEMVHSTRASVMEIDERVDLRHTKPAAPYAGVATRGAALLLDALLAGIVFLICAAGVALIGSLAGGFHHGWVLDTIAAAGWALVQIVYFVGYWSTIGPDTGHASDGRAGLRPSRPAARLPAVVRAARRALARDRDRVPRLRTGALRPATPRPAGLPRRDRGRVRRPGARALPTAEGEAADEASRHRAPGKASPVRASAGARSATPG